MSLSCGVRNRDTGGMSLLRLAISEAEGKFRRRHILTVFRVSRAGHSCVSAMRARLCLCQNCIVYAYGRTPGCPDIGYLAHPFAIHFGFGTLHRTEKAGHSLGRHFLRPRHDQFRLFPIVRPTHGHICHTSNHKTNARFLRVRYRFNNQHTTNLLYDQSHDQ